MLSNKKAVVVLPAVDLDRARHFYHDKLGLAEEAEKAGGLMFQAGEGSRVYIYEKPEGTKAEHTAASFIVDDVEAEVAELRGRGIEFEEYDFPGLKTEHGIATMDSSKSAWFRDSEGNVIAISQM